MEGKKSSYSEARRATAQALVRAEVRQDLRKRPLTMVEHFLTIVKARSGSLFSCL
jgi:hypothetical protein